MNTCPVCHNQVPVGTRWCPICHTNLFNPGVRLATPGKRLGAYVLDGLVVWLALWIILCGGAGLAGAISSDPQTSGGVGWLIILLGVGAYSVWSLWLFAHGTTPGKMLLKMYVMKEDGNRAVLGRCLRGR